MQIGDIVKSKAGHDAGRLYLIVTEEGSDFVRLADGKYRLLSNLKRKRKKHLSFVANDARLSGLMESGKLRDEDIKHVLGKIK